MGQNKTIVVPEARQEVQHAKSMFLNTRKISLTYKVLLNVSIIFP